jgi:hypothetical protein
MTRKRRCLGLIGGAHGVLAIAVMLKSVKSVVTMLARSGHEITTAAIYVILDDPLRFPENEISNALDELRAGVRPGFLK